MTERNYQRESDKELGRLIGTIEEFMRSTKSQVTTLFNKIDDFAARSVTRQDLEELERKQDAHAARDSKEHEELREMNTTNELVMQGLAEKLIGTDEQEGRDGLISRVSELEKARAFVLNGASMIRWLAVGVAGSVTFAIGALELYHRISGH